MVAEQLGNHAAQARKEKDWDQDSNLRNKEKHWWNFS